MIQADLNNWILFSERRNSTSYISRDGKYILKTSSESHTFTLDEMEYELQNSRAAIASGIKTPTLVDVAVLPDGGYGIIAECITGKESYAKLIGNNPDKIEELMKSYALSAKKLHSCVADQTLIPSLTKRLQDILEKTDIYTDREKSRLIEKASLLSEKNTCLQVDFTPSNIIVSNGNSYFIDLGLLSYGNPLFDIGFFWYVANLSNERVYRKIFHTDTEGANHCWRAFAKYYFDSDDIKGIEELVKPYGVISVHLMLNVLPNTSFIIENKKMILE